MLACPGESTSMTSCLWSSQGGQLRRGNRPAEEQTRPVACAISRIWKELVLVQVRVHCEVALCSRDVRSRAQAYRQIRSQAFHLLGQQKSHTGILVPATDLLSKWQPTFVAVFVGAFVGMTEQPRHPYLGKTCMVHLVRAWRGRCKCANACFGGMFARQPTYRL